MSKLAPARKVRFRHESLETREAIVKYLRALTEGFESGRITLSDEERVLQFEPHGLLHLEVDGSIKPDRVRIGLRCTWTPPTDDGEGRSLSIVAGVPRKD